MVCSIAYNRPLTKMRSDLGLPEQCHGLRNECVKGYRPASRDFAMGVPGAALGYCQALFNRGGASGMHTSRVMQLLDAIGAPWAHSHELFWGYRQEEGPAEFIEQGVLPLRRNGRVPILITNLDPGPDIETIRQIVGSSPSIGPGETILVRIVLRDQASIGGAARLMREIHENAVQRAEMPKWWPLLQGQLSPDQWFELKQALNGLWDYSNIAVNPFTPPEITDALADQVTVGQIVLGHADGVQTDGTIALAPGMKISGASDGATYSLHAFMETLAELPVVPTLIVLGPSAPTWTDQINQERIAALLPPLRNACDVLWRDLVDARRDKIWSLSA